ncbi:MAG: hypothetical protein KDC93_10585 [Cyclobacteriaceae bacterium]|nr:hypothetical protein [Cyclobacteriaceae bacterium]
MEYIGLPRGSLFLLWGGTEITSASVVVSTSVGIGRKESSFGKTESTFSGSVEAIGKREVTVGESEEAVNRSGTFGNERWGAVNGSVTFRNER